MNRKRVRARALAGAAAGLTGLAFASSAWAHAEISPPVTKSKTAQLFTLAQRFFGKGDLPRAEEAFDAVVKADAQNHRARAFLAWILFWKKSEADRSTAVDSTLKTVREALRSAPDFALGHYFVGSLCKLRNEMPKAEQAFRIALSHDPNLLEAQRELRLINSRKTHR